jgi:hypothetical protein
MSSRPPPRRLTPAEIERAVDGMVEEFANRLGIPVEQGRMCLHAITSILHKHGITIEAAIEALTDPPPGKPN